MIVGVPKEIKTAEHRIALVPAGVESLVGDGHSVLVEQGAGIGSGFADEAYRVAGGTLVPRAADVWAKAEMVVKVKEPIEPEWPCMRDRKSTRLNSSHLVISYAVFCLKKKKRKSRTEDEHRQYSERRRTRKCTNRRRKL